MLQKIIFKMQIYSIENYFFTFLEFHLNFDLISIQDHGFKLK